MKYLKKLTATTLAILMAFCLMTYQEVYAESNAGYFTVTGGTQDTDWTYDTNTNTITINQTGTYTITGDDNVYSDYQIVISGGIEVNLTIKDVKITSSSGAAMSIANTATVTLILEGDNSFTSTGSNYAGIQFNNASTGSCLLYTSPSPRDS